MAALLVGWLSEQDWTVYQEVTSRGGPRADIVATRGVVLWVIETKLGLSLAVLGQALHWLGRANMVSVATESTPRGSALDAARRFLEVTGIGRLHVGTESVHEYYPARLIRRSGGDLRAALRDEHRTFAPAGNAAGSYWSPFQATCKALREKATREPGQTMREVIATIQHHYASPASARGALTRWIETGRVPGVEVRRDGKTLRVYPVEQGRPQRVVLERRQKR